MSFDLATLRHAVSEHGTVARVVIAKVMGSSPREVGAAMLVWSDGQSGTIGGGALEFQASADARHALKARQDRLSRHALGPELGQCCGGSVTLLREVYDADRINMLEQDRKGGDVIALHRAGCGVTNNIIVRPIDAGHVTMSAAVRRILDRNRAQGQRPEPQLIDGWMIEPISQPQQPLWIWGAGHVGRAFVSVLSPLPHFEITWIDTDISRFPDDAPKTVTRVPAKEPERLLAHAPKNAHHLFVTYSHALDLALCDAALRRGFDFAGLIGSATKWARFRKRLGELGHEALQISQITCPIGDPALGKHPQAIAIGVAARLVERTRRQDCGKRKATG